MTARTSPLTMISGARPYVSVQTCSWKGSPSAGGFGARGKDEGASSSQLNMDGVHVWTCSAQTCLAGSLHCKIHSVVQRQLGVDQSNVGAARICKADVLFSDDATRDPAPAQCGAEVGQGSHPIGR